MYKSSKLYLIFYKYVCLLFSSIWVINWLYLSIAPDSVITINGVTQEANFLNSIIFLIFGAIFSLPYFLVGKKMVYVEMENVKIRIKKNGQFREYEWSQVEYIQLSLIILPPTYRLKITGNPNTFLFCTGINGFAVPFYVWDFTEMGKFIKKMKQENRL